MKTMKRRRWSESEIEFVKSNPNMPIKEIGYKLGRSKSSLNKLRSSLGIYSDAHTPWTPEELGALETHQRLSNQALADLLGKRLSQVAGARKHHKQQMIRTCLMCGGSYQSRWAAAKVCRSCNPSGIRDKFSPLVRLKHYAEGAQERGLPFELTPPEFYAFWRKPCSYCGSEIQTIGLDRVVSAIGYTVENVVPCCSRCNEMKNNATLDGWIHDMKRVLAHMGEI